MVVASVSTGLSALFFGKCSTWITAASLGLLVTLIIRYRERLAIFSKTLPRDLRAIFRYAKLFIYMNRSLKRKSICEIFADNVRKTPGKVAFQFVNGAKMTFAEFDSYTNRVARYFRDQGCKKGDVVALFMDSQLEYICLWFGLAKIGVITALINSNQRKQSLLHSITVANCSAIIYGYELREAIAELSDHLKHMKQYVFDEASCKEGENCSAIRLRPAIAKTSNSPLNTKEILAKSSMTDKLIYIYTSGTTGLPKAANISHARFTLVAHAAKCTGSFSNDDIFYSALPLYHSAGGMMSVGQALINGNTVICRKKFSASNFWKDCVTYKCTVAQYIGEVCRFLLNTPEQPEEKQHRIRIMIGNGLRIGIWSQFVERFNIGRICEFYGATEGNANIINFEGHVGAVGFIPIFAQSVHPLVLLRCDQITGEVIRNSDGYCTKCEINEPGLLASLIKPNKVINEFPGYVDKTATEKKILRNVFCPGDAYFNSGDVLYRDKYGYFYFRDRTGDTFRWRGENVASTEVENTISSYIGLKDATVYGVEIPNVEGRAGMLAILDPNHTVDLDALAKIVVEHFAPYARPIFVRLLQQAHMTGTFKLIKRDLQIEGYDVNKIKDQIYFFQNNRYVPLTSDLYDDILNGKLKF